MAKPGVSVFGGVEFGVCQPLNRVEQLAVMARLGSRRTG